jgi:ADP-ribose pyrophosphatase YjhB (NUDIX family)
VSTTIWRPPAIVRPIAVGIIRRGDELLLMAVKSDAGAIKGWRPLGGTIEFSERAADALKREFVEEIGVAIAEPTLISVLESLYRHHDTPGHEIVFVFEARLANENAYRQDGFTFDDGGVRNDVRWVALEHFSRRPGAIVPGRSAGAAREIVGCHPKEIIAQPRHTCVTQ